MSRAEGLAVISAVFREQFLDDGLVLDESSSPQTIAAWDSIAQIGLLLTIETRLGVKFTVEEMASIGSVRAILDALTAKGALAAA